MTPGAWIMLIVTWTLILGLTAFCFARIFRGKDE
jgi:hypothetical protein